MRSSVVVAVMLVALSGCSGGSDGEKIIADSPSPTPTPTATKSKTNTLLDLVPDKPVRPKDEKTEAGAIAMAEYLFKAVYYAYGIGDPEPVREVADKKGRCSGCETAIRNVATARDNGVVFVGSTPIETSDASVINVDGDFATVELMVDYPETLVINAKTGKVDGDRLARSSDPAVINLWWIDGSWNVLDWKGKDKE